MAFNRSSPFRLPFVQAVRVTDWSFSDQVSRPTSTYSVLISFWYWAWYTHLAVVKKLFSFLNSCRSSGESRPLLSLELWWRNTGTTKFTCQVISQVALAICQRFEHVASLMSCNFICHISHMSWDITGIKLSWTHWHVSRVHRQLVPVFARGVFNKKLSDKVSKVIFLKKWSIHCVFSSFCAD